MERTEVTIKLFISCSFVRTFFPDGIIGRNFLNMLILSENFLSRKFSAWQIAKSSSLARIQFSRVIHIRCDSLFMWCEKESLESLTKHFSVMVECVIFGYLVKFVVREWLRCILKFPAPCHIFDLNYPEVARGCEIFQSASFAPFFRRLAANWVSALIKILSEYRAVDPTSISTIYHPIHENELYLYLAMPSISLSSSYSEKKIYNFREFQGEESNIFR